MMEREVIEAGKQREEQQGLQQQVDEPDPAGRPEAVG
jgi:hypothetical protein